jgi:hypothetical protein
MTQIRGNYKWTCNECGKTFTADTPQGMGMKRSNHLRSHGISTDGDYKP